MAASPLTSGRCVVAMLLQHWPCCWLASETVASVLCANGVVGHAFVAAHGATLVVVGAEYQRMPTGH